MTTLIVPKPIGVPGANRVRCTSKRDWAAAHYVVDPVTRETRLKVYARSDSAHALALRIKKQPGWTFVFRLSDGKLIWQNSCSEWLAAESAILNSSRGY
jgi:hypothetical protein